MDINNVKTLIWDRNSLKLIDQRELPFKQIYIETKNSNDVALAIKDMVVRGAPAIGVTAAYGVALAAINFKNGSISEFEKHIKDSIKVIASSRPTAVNLFWALERMKKTLEEKISKGEKSVQALKETLISEAEKIEKEDIEVNLKIGKNSLQIFDLVKKEKITILTHCNAGGLATAGYGTALGVIRSLNSAGFVKCVYVDETRPYLQGARLTAWELHQENIPYYVITDNMAGYFMKEGKIDIVVVGADRIAANGDTANKIGTYSLSVLAKHHNLLFFIAAPFSTIDFNTRDGLNIIIEQRPAQEVRKVLGVQIIPEYMPVLNPSFDITPSENISGIITEKGLIYPPFNENLYKFLKL